MRLAPLLLMALLFGASAEAAKFRLPLNNCDVPTRCLTLGKCYITAYFDLNTTAGALADWNCGQNTYDGHRGTDYGIGGFTAMDNGSRPIVAGADGVVITRQDGLFDRQVDFSACSGSGSAGNYVALRHADGMISVYLHMKKGTVNVASGQAVKCGELLGYVGSSGCSTGPHLHFEVDLTGAAFAGADDPYAAKAGCGGQLSYFTDQGAYCGVPGICCEGGCAAVADGAAFVSETITDGTHFAMGAAFTKKWTLKNSGTTSWTAAGKYSWTFDGQETYSAPAQTAFAAGETIAPGASKEWTLAMTAPGKPGSFRGYWRMTHDGVRFGDRVWAEIVVDPPAGTTDFDGDGHDSIAAGGDDCDDGDKDVHPGHPEVCDGKDNDCDGVPDENLTRICNSKCGPGTESCIDGKFSGCSAPQPKAEECNGFDDDCDGVVDNGLTCTTAAGADGGPKAGDGGNAPGGPSDGSVPSGGCGCSQPGGLWLGGAVVPAMLSLRRRRRRA